MKVTFNINFHTVWGQKLCIVGSLPELGSWEPALAKEMNYKGDGNWQLELELELTSPQQTIEYRYFLSINDKQIFEEWEKNHQVTFEGHANHYTLYDYWQIRPANLAFYSSAFTKSLFAHPCNTYERVVKSGKKLTIKISAPRVEKWQSVAITGNQECLGNWHPDKALILSCDTFPDWHIDLDANDIIYPLEYKFLVYDNDKHQPLYWEEDENRKLDLPPQDFGETVMVSGLSFRDNLPLWRCAGTVIPVFSLRSDFINDSESRKLDGSVLCFQDNDTKWSYAKIDQYGIIEEIREKEVISPFATVGIYYFAKGKMFVENALDMIVRNDRVNNEFYVAPVYNYSIHTGGKYGIYNINKNEMHGTGTPNDLNKYIEFKTKK